MTTSTNEHGASRSRTTIVRGIAIGASAVAAVVYLLIGLRVLDIGESTATGTAPDLFAFGAMMSAVSATIALLLALARSRILWASVAVIQVLVLVGYVAMSNLREPAFDLWGMLIKACQLIVLAAMAYLLLHHETEPADAPGTIHGSVA